MAKKKPPREENKPDGEESALPKAKTAVVKAGEKVAQVSKAAKGPVVAPIVVVAVEIVKKKRPRFVREKKVQKAQTEATPLTPQSSTLAGKMMSKNIIPLPKDETDQWPKSKRKP
jgi:hypothetical protein